MRIPLIMAFIVLWPFWAAADIKWHEFGLTEGQKKTLIIGDVSFTIETRPAEESGFKEDYLLISVRRVGRTQREHRFTSSYGTGAVAVCDDVLLLKYGVGRGTSARVEHIQALSLTRSLEELFDIQTSYYATSRDPKQVSPDYIESRLRVEATRTYTTFIFSTPDAREGIPPEKVVRLKR
jgi:hypothetical protein